MTSKPTAADICADVDALPWRRSGTAAEAIEVASTKWSGEVWTLMRLADDPEERVHVFTQREWEAFLNGAKNGEFDDAVSEP